MKKIFVVLLSVCLVLPLFAMTSSANSYHNPAPVTIDDESILLITTEDEAIDDFELSIPTSLEYQNLVVPYGTDLSEMKFKISLDKLQFSMSEDLLQLHGMEKENLNGYFDNMKEETTIRYAKNGGNYQSVSDEGIQLEAGARYTIVIRGWYGENQNLFCVSHNDSDIKSEKRWLDLSQERKFAFTVSVADPTILEGATHEMVEGTANPLTIKVDNDFSKFKGVECDGKLLTRDKDYTAVSGSTVVTISSDFMKTLTVGEHKIKILFSDDSSSMASIKVTEKQVATQESGAMGTTSPKTGDHAMVGITMMLLVGAMAMFVVVYRKRKYN